MITLGNTGRHLTSDQSEEIINLSAGVIGVGEGMGDQRGQVNVQRHDQRYDQHDFHHYMLTMI